MLENRCADLVYCRVYTEYRLDRKEAVRGAKKV